MTRLSLHYTLLLICAGLRTQQIADETGVPFATAQGRVQRLLRLYNARNRTHLAALALRTNLEWPPHAASRA